MQRALVQARKRGRNFIRLGSRTHWGNSAPGWNLKLHVHGTCRYFNNIIYNCASRASNSEPHMHAILRTFQNERWPGGTGKRSATRAAMRTRTCTRTAWDYGPLWVRVWVVYGLWYGLCNGSFMGRLWVVHVFMGVVYVLSIMVYGSPPSGIPNFSKINKALIVFQ